VAHQQQGSLPGKGGAGNGKLPALLEDLFRFGAPARGIQNPRLQQQVIAGPFLLRLRLEQYRRRHNLTMQTSSVFLPGIPATTTCASFDTHPPQTIRSRFGDY
jgi:hypothetical protein